MITQEHLDRAMSYAQYSRLLNELMAKGRTTGENQSEAYLSYAKLNLQRMHRVEKTAVLTTELKEALSKIKERCVWVVLTEGWCGDAAQSVPLFHSIEAAYPAIELKVLLRDENLDVMDQYLTDGSRSIPKLVCLRKEPNGDLREIFVWGPRPEAAQEIMLEYKRNNRTMEEKSLAIHKWYADDKTLTLQSELLALIQRLF